MVSATLSRSHDASARNISRCAHAPPCGSASRTRVPRPSTLVAYEPGGIASAHVTSTPAGASGTRKVAVAACPRACERAPSVELVLGIIGLLNCHLKVLWSGVPDGCHACYGRVETYFYQMTGNMARRTTGDTGR